MRAVSGPGEDRFRALCGPEGTAAEPSGGENAPCWPAAMAGEAHPVPSRTRKLSPLAPMVLRCSPWESRTPPASKGRFPIYRPRGRPPAALAAGGLPLRAGGPSPARGAGPLGSARLLLAPPAGDAPAGGPPEVLGAPPGPGGLPGDGSRRFSARRPAGGGGPRRQAARPRGLRRRPAGLARSERDRRGGPPG